MGSVIIGSGRALPARIVTNDELSEIVDTTDEWIVPRTGIHTRHVAIEETCTDLGAQAALRALGLEEGGWQREAGAIDAATLDMIICPTLTADTHFPSEAARIRERIGATNAVCYDMSCACSGCVYGLSTADLIMAGAAFARQEAARTGTPMRCNDVRRVLVVAAERLSKLVDWEERATCILFGDGAAAAVLTNGDAGTPKRCLPSAPRLRDVRCGADGRQYPLLTVGGGTNRNYKPGDPVQDDFYLQMQGREVFKQAVRSLSAVCSELLEDNGLTLEDIDLFIPHQANLRIIEAVGDRLKLGSEKIFVNLDEYGNTSAASIPLGIGDACAQGRIRPGSRVLLSAFGGGFTWGAALLEF